MTGNASVPNSTRSRWRVSSAAVSRGRRPSSASRPAMSTWKLACSSSIRPTQPRSSALQPTCAPMNVVPGWAATSPSSASMRRSNVGSPGRPKCQSGWDSSSSSRSLCRSSGAKNATGSAVWISTGRPSSPAAAKTGPRRGSSGRTSRPSGPV
ncbi:hypothetical protein [Actinomadura sp. J1-007]|uniref:hypothetical protein n=1 Tax=Actinomadura sp. J1-007 TaxID=2661913 RepID=UPI001F4FB142|nr:hypothetical protein [Actinomadura sp. J1-007]